MTILDNDMFRPLLAIFRLSSRELKVLLRGAVTKFPELWYSTNGRTYDNAYLITFKVRPLRTHTLAPSILPLLDALAGSFFWNLPEFSRRIRFYVLHGAKRVPLRHIFRTGNSRKSLGARSLEYGGWVMTGMLFSARNCCTTSDVWLGASS